MTIVTASSSAKPVPAAAPKTAELTITMLIAQYSYSDITTCSSRGVLLKGNILLFINI